MSDIDQSRRTTTNPLNSNAFEFYRNSDFRCEHVGEQPVRARPSRSAQQHILRRHARRPASCRTNCSSSPTTRDRARMRRASRPHRWLRRRGAAATCRASPRRSATRRRGRRSPAIRFRSSRFSPTARALLNDLDELSAAEPHGAWRDHRQLRRRDAARDSRAPGRRARRLERRRATTSSSAAIRSRTYEDRRDKQPFPLVLADTQRPAVLQHRRSTGIASSARR